MCLIYELIWLDDSINDSFEFPYSNREFGEVIRVAGSGLCYRFSLSCCRIILGKLHVDMEISNGLQCCGCHPRWCEDFKDATSTIHAGIKDPKDVVGSNLFRTAQSLQVRRVAEFVTSYGKSMGPVASYRESLIRLS